MPLYRPGVQPEYAIFPAGPGRVLPGMPGERRDGSTGLRVHLDAGALTRYVGETVQQPAPGTLSPLIIPVLDITPFIAGAASAPLPSLPALPGEPVYSEQTAPAAGADWTVDVPGDEAWRIHHVAARLVTNAVVANRMVTLAAYVNADATKPIMFSSIPDAVTAGQTALISFNIGQPPGLVPTVGIWEGFIAGNLTLLPGTRLGLWVYNLNAGDQMDRIIIAYERFRA